MLRILFSNTLDLQPSLRKKESLQIPTCIYMYSMSSIDTSSARRDDSKLVTDSNFTQTKE